MVLAVSVKFCPRGFNDVIYPEIQNLKVKNRLCSITSVVLKSVVTWLNRLRRTDDMGGLAVNITLTAAGGAKNGEFTARVKRSHERDPVNLLAGLPSVLTV